MNNPKKVTCRFCPCFVFETFRIFTDARGCWHVGGIRPMVSLDTALVGILHCMPCHGHSRCMFHAACTSRSCTAHARDFDARASRLSWPSDQDNPHEHPLDYHIIRNLSILNWAYRRNERPDPSFRYLDVRGTRKERIMAVADLIRWPCA